MFADIKLDAKLIGAGIVVAIILVVCGVIWYQHSEVKSLNTQAGAASATIAAQAAAGSEAHATIQNQQASAQVTDAGNQAIIAAPAANQAQQDAVQAKTDTTIAAVKQQYSTLPQSDANAKAEDVAIATAQINGLWDTYCNTTPDTNVPECQAPQQ